MTQPKFNTKFDVEIHKNEPTASTSKTSVFVQSLNKNILSQFTEAITQILNNKSNNTTTTITGGYTIPIFNPSDVRFNSETWCKRVDVYKQVRCSKKTTAYFAISKFSGLAETWYQSLPTLMRT